MTNIYLFLCTSLSDPTELLFIRPQMIKEVEVSGKDAQAVSFIVVCSTLLKQQAAGLNVSLQMFVIVWIISYARCDLAALVTELFSTQQFYKNSHIFWVRIFVSISMNIKLCFWFFYDMDSFHSSHRIMSKCGACIWNMLANLQLSVIYLNRFNLQTHSN